MGQNGFYHQSLSSEIGKHNQAVLVAADVEYQVAAYPVGAGKIFSDIGEAGVVRFAHMLEPVVKRLPCVWMSGRELRKVFQAMTFIGMGE